MVSWFNRRLVPIFLEVRRRTADIYAFLEEYLRGARVVQAFDREDHVIERMDQTNEAKAQVESHGEILANWFGHLVFLSSGLATALILGVGGGWALARPDLLSIGTLVA